MSKQKIITTMPSRFLDAKFTLEEMVPGTRSRERHNFGRPSHRAREQVEDDEERLAKRQSDMPPPVFERVANPRRSSSAGFSKELGQDAPVTHEDACT